MMKIKSFTFNDYQENTFLIIKNRKCIIIDPGNYYDDENMILKNYIAQNSLIPQFILITHVHIDHVLGIEYLSKKYSIETFIPETELDFYDNMINYSYQNSWNNINQSLLDLINEN